MFRFENPIAFYGLLLIPLVVLVWVYSQRLLKQRISSLGTPTIIQRLINGKVPLKARLLLFIIVIISLVFAWANPQWGLKKEKVMVEKSDIFIALDISASMNAQDISPSRLEKSKRFIEQFIDTRKGDQLGLIYFAGGAYLQMPLTSDFAAAQLFARSANTDMAGTQGTVIGEAIDLAMRSVKEQSQRALIIISDGEDHDDNAISMTQKAKDNGWNIFTIGAGTEKGAFIPILNEGREEFKMDEEGNPVTSKLNQNLLKDIADSGNGTFYMLDNEYSAIISDINSQLDKMQKREVEVKSYTEYQSYFSYFLVLAFVLLMVDFFWLTKARVVE